MLLGWIEERHKASSVLEQMGDVFIRVVKEPLLFKSFFLLHPLNSTIHLYISIRATT